MDNPVAGGDGPASGTVFRDERGVHVVGGAFVVLTEALILGAAPLRPRLSLAADTLATALPVAPGYVGTFDYFAAPGFAVYGSTASTASHPASSHPWNTTASPTCRTGGAKRRNPSSAR